MRILLIVPPWRTTDALVAQLYPQPYGLAMIAAVLKQAGHEVEIKDFLVPAQRSKCPAPASFAGKSAPPYLHYGEPEEGVYRWLWENEARFDVYGLALGQCNLFEMGGKVARYIKNNLKMPLVIGGPFATTAPEEALMITGADAIVQGEGESVVDEAFTAAYAGLDANHQGWRFKGIPQNLDYLPLPRWDLAQPSKYPAYNGMIRGVLSVSRGCPWACAFCSVHTIAGRTYRRLKPEGIRLRLDQLAAFGVRYFCFLDDNLFFAEKHVDEICGIIDDFKRHISFKPRFYLEEGMEVRIAAKPGVVAKIKEAGFENIAIGLESMSAAARAGMKKPFSEEELKQAIANFRSAGVTPKAFYIVGFPGDTTQSVARDILEFAKIGMAARPNNLKLYPGTEITQQFKEQNLIDDAYDWRLSSFWTPSTPDLPFKMIKKLKTELGSLGVAAGEFGINIADDNTELEEKFGAKKYKFLQLTNGLSLEGNMFRPTPLMHLLEMILLVRGAAGAKSIQQGDHEIQTLDLAAPKDAIQAAFVRAIGMVGPGPEQKALFDGGNDEESGKGDD